MMAAALMAQKSLANTTNSSSKSAAATAALFSKLAGGANHINSGVDKENTAIINNGDGESQKSQNGDDEDESDSNYMNKLRQVAKPVRITNGNVGAAGIDDENSMDAAAVSETENNLPAAQVANLDNKPKLFDECQSGAKKRKRQFISTLNQQFQVDDEFYLKKKLYSFIHY